MKILVTGGAGFIGTNLVKKLVKKGHQVFSIDNYSTGLKQNKQSDVSYIHCDINDWYYHIKFDVVFHMAAIARIQPSFKEPEKYINTNFNGTYKIVKYCAKNNIPIIYAGSSSHHSGKFSNPYTFSKDMGEEIIQLYQNHFKLKSTTARFYNVYGPYQLTEGGYTTLIGRWINNISKSLPCEIYGDGEQRRDFTHVDDIVNALILIMDKKAYGNVFELGRGKNISVNEVAKMFKITPNYKKPKPGEARNTLCESKLAKEILDWHPKINLLDYIKNYNYENKFNTTK